MAQSSLSATPQGNGFQGTITYSYGVSICSAETYPTIAEAIPAAAIKMLEMPERLEEIDRSQLAGSASISGRIYPNAKLRDPSKKQREEALTDFPP